MSSDEPPPRPARTTGRLAYAVAVFALAGVALAVIGADTVVTDTAGAAPIVDDASRHDPVAQEHSQETADEGPAAGQDQGADVPPARCIVASRAPSDARGCSPPTLRGPPRD